MTGEEVCLDDGLVWPWRHYDLARPVDEAALSIFMKEARRLPLALGFCVRGDSLLVCFGIASYPLQLFLLIVWHVAFVYSVRASKDIPHLYFSVVSFVFFWCGTGIYSI